MSSVAELQVLRFYLTTGPWTTVPEMSAVAIHSTTYGTNFIFNLTIVSPLVLSWQQLYQNLLIIPFPFVLFLFSFFFLFFLFLLHFLSGSFSPVTIYILVQPCVRSCCTYHLEYSASLSLQYFHNNHCLYHHHYHLKKS